MKKIGQYITSFRKKHSVFFTLLIIAITLWGLLLGFGIFDEIHDVGMEIGAALAK